EEMRRSWGRGERAPAEDYLARHPAVAADPEAAVEVVYQEFVLREADEFLRRFPHLADRLRPLFELELALGVGRLVPPAPPSTGDAPNLATTPLGAEDGEARSTWPTAPGYEVVGLIGAGGMGEVYQATDPTFRRPLAVKALRAGAGANPG